MNPATSNIAIPESDAVSQPSLSIDTSKRTALRTSELKLSPTFDAPRVFVMLPAFNEEESLPDLLAGLGDLAHESGIPYRIVVVDDGSADKTAEIADELSLSLPVQLVKHEKNKGLGEALMTGIRTVLEQAGDNDILITMDSDNTHPPHLLMEMVGKIRNGLDVVIASRFRSGARVIGVPAHRELMSQGVRFLFTVFFPTIGVRDYTCGYRAYRVSSLRAAQRHYGDQLISESGFACMVDLLLKLRKQKAIFGEVPLILRYDRKGGASKMNVSRTIYRTLRLLFRRRFLGG
jgi:dolichol-phosphate mannosyltransferase